MKLFILLFLLLSCASPKMTLKEKLKDGGVIEYRHYGLKPHLNWQNDLAKATQCKYGHSMVKHGKKSSAGIVNYDFNSLVKKDIFSSEDELKNRPFIEQKKKFRLNMQATKDAVNIPDDGKYMSFLYQFKCLGLEKDTCLKGGPEECYRYAKELELQGKLKQAYKFHKYGCKVGGPKSCHRAANIIFKAQKKKMSKSALKLFKKSCTEEYPNGCYTLAEYFSKKKRIMQSLGYYSLHCNFDAPEDDSIDNDQLLSCLKAGEISFLRDKKSSAIEFYERGCDMRGKSTQSEISAMRSCARLGLLNKNKDLRDLGMEHLSVTCNEKRNKEACYEVATLYVLKNNHSMALKYLERLFKLKFKNWSDLNRDRMLSSIKKTSAFKTLIKKYLRSTKKIKKE